MTEHHGSPDMERQPVGVVWHDLQGMKRLDTLRELVLPLPWLALALVLFSSSYWPLGVLPWFAFFLCALRLNHEAIHGNLGLPRRADKLILHVLSGLMGASNSAVAHGHLVHHKHAMGPGDFEGRCGEMSLVGVLLYGPRFQIDITRHAWSGSGRAMRRRIALDWGLNAAMVALAIFTGWQVLILHVAAMAVAQCMTAFFCVWITHHGATEHGLAARSQRGIGARLAYLMFYHREHHLYPKVPVHRLPEMARRLDDSVPGFAEDRMPVLPFLERTQNVPSAQKIDGIG